MSSSESTCKEIFSSTKLSSCYYISDSLISQSACCCTVVKGWSCIWLLMAFCWVKSLIICSSCYILATSPNFSLAESTTYLSNRSIYLTWFCSFVSSLEFISIIFFKWAASYRFSCLSYKSFILVPSCSCLLKFVNSS